MIFPQDPKIDIGKDGFAGKDLLGRKEFGQRLTDLVDRIEQPLVIALDGEWGSGKSHFLKLWAGAHKKELTGPNGQGNGQAEVIYFDAFEHDFLDDPLVSLISRLADEAAPKTWGVAAIKTLKKSAFPLVKMVSRVGLAVATYGATEMVKPVVDVAIAKVSETTDAAIDQFWKNETNRIKAMQGFRDALTALTIKEDGTTQKIVFIIDELDRCRPDYALNLLEIIKHFFAVPNVHFVLGVNLHALEHSVRARYGQGIDAAKYLQKFVMLTMTLPKQDRVGHALVPQYFQQVVAQSVTSEPLKSLLGQFIEPLLESSAISLREIHRVLTVFALSQNVFDSLLAGFREDFGYRSFLVGAALLKVLQPLAYNKLRSHSLTLDELASALKIQPWKQLEHGRRTDRRWVIWAIILAPERLTIENIPPDDISLYLKSFGPFSDSFSPSQADVYLAQAFDTFTLPDPP